MRTTLLGFFTLAVTISIIAIWFFRKDLPYHFDFVRTPDGVAIINTDSWNTRPLEVKVVQNGNILASETIDPESDSCVITNLKPIGEATIVISRTDLIGKARYKALEENFNFNGKAQSYFVLVGASIGYAWDLPNLAERTKDASFAMGNRALYKFDKSEGILPLTKLKYKPRAVIIKQCSIYYPRDMDESSRMLKGWVDTLKKNGIGVVLATTTPVAKEEPREGQQEAIDQWNQFIRDYAQSNNMPVLDLAKALQSGWFDTHMKAGFYQDDGYHLTPLAYEKVMDPLLVDFIHRQYPQL